MQNHTLRNYCGTTADGIHCRSAKKDYERQRKEWKQCGKTAEMQQKDCDTAEMLRKWCGETTGMVRT